MSLATFIPYPDVPAYPGVPALSRPASAAIAADPVLSIGIGTVENIIHGALQQAPRWGIFDAAGNQLGVVSRSFGAALLTELTGGIVTVLSTVCFDFAKESKISDFVTEAGSFANYNKVQMPANPVVTLALDGSENDRAYFLSELDAACSGIDLYTVVTPEVTYYNYSIERFTYSRRASRGATLLIVEVSLKEIRQVAASFAKSVSPISNPANASATPQVNNGMTQPSAPDTSTLKSLAAKLGF